VRQLSLGSVASKPWYEAEPESYRKLQAEVADSFPELRFVKRGHNVVVTGYYPLYEKGKVYERYLVEIEIPKHSPRDLPVIREIAERIPRHSNRHMEEDGKACVVLPDAFWHDHPDGMSLLQFLNGPVRAFFSCQSLIELGEPNPWPSGEWDHGAKGIIEFYGNLLDTSDPHKILEYLKLIKAKFIKGHWTCPCGTGAKLRNCHKSVVEQLRSRIPRSVVSQSEERLFNFLRDGARSQISRRSGI
jgi:hypothetical protein